MEDFWLGIRLLLLLATASIAPIAAKHLLGQRWAFPMDAGVTMCDGRPLLGASKTVRGVVAAVCTCGLCAPLLGFPVAVGVLLGAGAMGGDAMSSFIKRRLAIEPSGQAFGLDQIPEALLGLLAVAWQLDLSPLQVVAVTAAFFVLEIPLARVSHRLGLRDRPY